MNLKFKVVLEKDEKSGYTVHVPALPGCHTQGDDITEALENAREAIECYLESMQKDGIDLPKNIEEHVFEVEVAA